MKSDARFMEFELFEKIRDAFCAKHTHVSVGTMMSSPAIHYKGKVFAFFSRRSTMVFKLGKTYPVDALEIEIEVFNPFKNKAPLSGWYEVGFNDHAEWDGLTSKALELMALNPKK
ncbi:hypothetical protein WIW50_06100 [Flavobacteriaceae bacterium 3-367]